MRDVIYWPKADRLVYLDEAASPEYWDRYWQSQGKPPTLSQRDYVVTETKRYLVPGSRVLEGGCGRGNRVKAIADAGFAAVGVDFAGDAVQRAGQYYPDLDIRMGDVRSLDFPSHSFDGYWSMGVIEHFWDGYDRILAEAARVLKPGGLLFLTAPWLSPYRRHKARAGGYPSADFADEPGSFYQFGLGRSEVSAQLERHGFRLLRWRGLASEISMKQDMASFRSQIEWLFGSRGSIVKRVLRRVVTRGFNRYCGHSFLAVARCNKAAVNR